MFAKLRSLSILIAASAGLAAALWGSARAVGIYSPVFAFVVTWVPNAWMRIIFWLRPLSLPERYYRIRPFERSLYQLLLVKVAKRAVASRLWAGVNPHLRDLCRRNSLHQLEMRMRHAETSHLLVFLFALPLVALAFWNGRFEAAGFLVAFNILLNGYPIMVQRLNRRRIASALTRENRKGSRHRNG